MPTQPSTAAQTATRHREIQIAVGDHSIHGTLVAPDTVLPGILLVHGWDGCQQQYLARAHEIAALGCVCLTFDMQGHAKDRARRATITREHNLQDVLAAYDMLVGHPAVDPDNIAVAGSSYGAYLATLLTAERAVRWLSLRAPALYKDEDWAVPKQDLPWSELSAYRASVVTAQHNRALAACARFRGDVMLIESEFDDRVPHTVIENYRNAFGHARSMTYRLISGADHGLSTEAAIGAYTKLLVHWMAEMVRGARDAATAEMPAAAAPAAGRSA